jgi:DNA-binding winged helix-turn-helix (wHTH) protein
VSTDGGGSDVKDCRPAATLALADQELHQGLQLIARAYAVLAAGSKIAGSATGAVLSDKRIYRFGRFQLCPSQRLLLEGKRKVQLGSRAFDILTLLVERAGDVVGKQELIARAWPNVFVNDSNLKTQVSALRQVLGETRSGRGYFVTIHGRGYTFVEPVRLAEGPAIDVPEPVQVCGYDHRYGKTEQQAADPIAELIRALSPCA